MCLFETEKNNNEIKQTDESFFVDRRKGGPNQTIKQTNRVKELTYNNLITTIVADFSWVETLSVDALLEA